MRIGVSIPQLDATSFDAGAVREYLQRAEELGFDSAWTIEQSPGPTPLLAPLELLAWSAAVTGRIRLGVAVLVSTLHDPIQLAASVTAVDRLSHGRLEVGVATGGGSRDFGAFGVDPATFVRRFTDGLQLMKGAWSDGPVTFHGAWRTLDEMEIEPKPVQRPHPPLWFGASAPKALARAVRLGDGFLGAGSTTTQRFVDQVALVRTALEHADRDPAAFGIGKRIYLAVDDDPDRARTAVLTGLRRLYGPAPQIEAAGVSGTPDQVAAAVQTVLDAGAGLVVLNPLGADVAADRHQLERLAAEVVPRLRDPA